MSSRQQIFAALAIIKAAAVAIFAPDLAPALYVAATGFALVSAGHIVVAAQAA